jgi:membrane fusion protein (multidrug efflux system)
MPPAVVAAAPAERVRWPTQLHAVGNLRAERGVDITSASAGIVSAIGFDSGARVQRGEVIAQLDDAGDRGQLAALQAQLEQAQSDLARARRLAAQGAVAAAQAERSATAVKTLRSQISAQRAAIDDKRIEAPFDGELGIRRIDLGQFVQPGQPVVTLQQIAPILVDFTLPERHYGQLQPGQPIELTVDAWPDRRFTGEVIAVSPRVDETTRNFAVQGRLPNGERLLRPGMFATLTVTLPDARDLIVVPSSAISYSPSGDSVFVVRPTAAASAPQASSAPLGASAPPTAPENGTALPRAGAASMPGAGPAAPPLVATRVLVQTGERRGTRTAVRAGLHAGDRVVTAGQLKLFPGAPVIVSPAESIPSRR